MNYENMLILFNGIYFLDKLLCKDYFRIDIFIFKSEILLIDVIFFYLIVSNFLSF